MTRLVWIGLLCVSAAPCRQAPDNALEYARTHPGDFQANHLAGERLLAEKHVAAAIPYLDQAWRIDPSNELNGYDLALACLETGAAEKSRQVLLALIARTDKADYHNLLADVEESEGRVDEAADQYELAARMDPSEKNLFDLGSDLLKHRGFAPALKLFQYAVARYANSAELRVGLGIAYYSLGQYDDAVRALCEAVDLNPKDAKALDFLGKMYDISPQYADDVTKRLAHFVAIYPGSGAANYYYALSLRKRNAGAGAKARQPEAEAYLVKATRLNPGFGDAHFELGLLYEDEARDPEAIREFAMAAKLQPDHVKAHYHLALLYRKSGQETLAQREFQTVQALKGSR